MLAFVYKEMLRKHPLSLGSEVGRAFEVLLIFSLTLLLIVVGGTRT